MPAPATPTVVSGPEALILRIPRGGGRARAFDYGRLDSAVWTSSERAPGVARVLAFDEDAGAVAVVDVRGAPRRIELRTGTTTAPPAVKLTALHSADGAAVYGVSPVGAVTRLTPTDVHPWTLRPPMAARDVAPQPDGSVIIVGDAGDATTLWRVHPPGTVLLDTTVLPRVERLVRAAVGDRAYFASDSVLQPVRTRDLKAGPVMRFERRLHALAPTPSGDRLYVALDSAHALTIIDRYTDRESGTVALPGSAAELRMDPLGRFLLVRPAHAADSVRVVAVGTDRVTGHLRTTWTADLPFVGVDGSIVLAQGQDVVFVDPRTLAPRRTIAGGARDFWIPMRWDGFRPRAPGLGQPVTFPSAPGDSGDSILAAIRRSQRESTVAQRAPTTATPPPQPAAVDSAQGRLGASAPVRSPWFTVQFAALLNMDSARARASRITVSGLHARVATTSRAGTTVYLVVLGPFPTRDAADAAGRASKQPNPWVYEGAP